MKLKIVYMLCLLNVSVLAFAQLKPLVNQYQISEINELNPTSGTYNVIGYVSKIYECPPCPKGALCKPCMGNHIVISETRSMLAKYALTDREMIVFIENGDGLKINRKYEFLIQILDVKTTDQVLNNPKLIYFERYR